LTRLVFLRFLGRLRYLYAANEAAPPDNITAEQGLTSNAKEGQWPERFYAPKSNPFESNPS
jgi:hypothetical protein